MNILLREYPAFTAKVLFIGNDQRASCNCTPTILYDCCCIIMLSSRLLILSDFYHPENNFSEGIVFSRVCDFVLFHFFFFFFFYFLGYTEYRESIALVRKIDLQILMKIHILRHADYKELIFGMSSVCLSVCLSVCRSLSVCLSVDTITQKIIELAQPNLVCYLI